jgi:integrase
VAHVVDKGTASRLRWKVRYRTVDGKARSRAFVTKAEALTFANSVDWQRGAGSLVDPKRSRLTFAEWVDRLGSAPTDLRPSSVARDNAYLGHRVLPHFASFRLCDVTTREVQAWADGLSLGERPLAAASVHRALHVLSKVLGAAVRDGRLLHNPTRGVVLPRLPEREARFLSSVELLSLEDAMPDRWALLVPFLVDVGLRIGEAAALRWRDVDTLRGRVHVRETYVEVRGRLLRSAQDALGSAYRPNADS